MTYELRDRNGNLRLVRLRPEVEIARQAMLAMNRIVLEFGMTPASRSRVKSAAVDPQAAKTARQRTFLFGVKDGLPAGRHGKRRAPPPKRLACLREAGAPGVTRG
ncbi:MAG: P27 family phage terminase small subunit [Candidatus Tectomicrobia bacterium]|nr:P27 family phage terminase small subunit [Candidatus Tectomicrobia bacterium]